MPAIPEGDDLVFPACAGMFLYCGEIRRLARGFPRVRGDVPPHRHRSRHCREFSPRARGCSFMTRASAVKFVVFPACAGMFLHLV